ncbi:hypothetical protein [Desulfitobacterium chlororespirans]|uniref:Uncharacterized protein n=1 Tax=Desulfitobacterium chlororespirans DSM 11544 TaxID=1121395 RepID=A0A1M7UYD6_9FIRM|nr:hypothetical protein [Desulfitobacterium chlororespirans]SHN87937.1 hypothetical protein SAMN02745215_05039 [Desulfitobacterium chlororespirans DSM 11544]
MKSKKKILVLTVMLMAVFLLVLVPGALAEDIQSSKIFTGSMKFLEDVGKALMILGPVAGVPIVAYFWFRRGAADEMDQKTWNKRIIVALISIVGVELTSVLINVFLYYYA